MKKLLAIVLTLSLIFCLVPMGTVFSSAATSGTTGDCTWTLNGTELTISGSGKMEDYSTQYASNGWVTTAPWGNNITSVTVKNGYIYRI